MSRKPRRNHSPALKAEVALEWSGRRIEDLQFALAESLKRQVSAGLQLLKLSKLGSNSGRGLVRELCPRVAAPLIHLPLEPQRLIRQLGVGWRPPTLLTHRRKADVEGSLPESCHWLVSRFDPGPPDDILKRDVSTQVVKLPPMWSSETTRCALIQIRNSCKTSG